MRTRILTLVVASVIAAFTSAGCASSSGSASPAASQATSERPAVQPARPTPSSPSALDANLHGIVVADNLGSSVQLRAVDPQTGAVTATHSFAGGVGTSRQAFNADFTAMAATGPQESDGSTTVGVLTMGGYEPLTSPPTSFGVVNRKQAIGFDPNGNLWFLQSQPDGSDQMYGYVEKAGDLSLQNHKVVWRIGHDWSANGMPSSLADQATLVPVAPNRYEPIPTLATTDWLYLPSGKTELQRDTVMDQYQVGKPLTLTTASMHDVATSGVPHSGLPRFATAVDSQWFLGLDTNGNQLYLGTVKDYSSVSLTPLLPANNWTVHKVVVSPDLGQLAFTASEPNGGPTHLFVAPLRGGQPHDLNFGGDLSPDSNLAAWLS